VTAVDLAARQGSAGVSPADAKGLYRAMYRARRFDDIAVGLQRQGALSGYGQALGQEAAQVGSAAALGDDDMVFPSYRQPGVALMRGVTIRELFLFYSRREYCPWDWRARGFAPYTVPVGSQLAHAVGWAMADQRAGREAVTLVYFGDGASSQGEVHEAMNLAGVRRAPVVFLCENNGWAISTAISQQTAAPALFIRAQGYGMSGFRVDGNDVIAVHDQVAHAVRLARAGFGPSLVEAVTYRMAGHTTSDDPRLYRPDDEVSSWGERDPIERHRRRALAGGGLDANAVAEITATVDEEMDEAVKSWVAEAAG
jgi:pyruvate dehydrogenase E1 component alpha subunit